MKFEIVKKKHSFLWIYLSIGLLVFSLGVTLIIITKGSVGRFGETELVLLCIIIFLLFVGFKIIPNLKIPKHTKIGYIHYNQEYIYIENFLGDRKFNLNEIDALKIKLFGYDGQHMLGDIKALGRGNSSAYPNMRPLDGLNNYIKIKFKDTELRHEFYIPTNSEYKELKQLIINWRDFSNFQIKIVR